jgi:hypothetical protein
LLGEMTLDYSDQQTNTIRLNYWLII